MSSFNANSVLCLGSGGGATAFCLCRPGSNPGTDLAFLVQNSCLSILNGRRAFS